MIPQISPTAGNDMTDALLAAMAGAGLHDPAHVRHTAALTDAVCDALGTTAEVREQARQVAVLHDLGKLGIARERSSRRTRR